MATMSTRREGARRRVGRQGDKYFLSEKYDEAEASYRAALERAPGDPELAAKLERASASGATGLSSGEAQNHLFREPCSPGTAAVRPRPRRARRGAARPRGASRRRGGGGARRIDPARPRRRRRGLVRAPPPHRSRAGEDERRRVDQLALERQAAARTRASRPDLQARAHARDPVRQQPRASVPGRRQDRILRDGHRTAGVETALAHRRRQLEQAPTRSRRPLRSDGRGRVHPFLPQRRRRPGLEAVRPRATPGPSRRTYGS